MNAQQRMLIKESWLQVTPIADQAASMFYDRLFEIDPALRPMFKTTDLAVQRKKLVQALGRVIGSIDRIEDVIPTLQDLGRRHVDYGVTDAHYDTVRAALLWTLEKGLGDAWSGDMADAWATAYGAISGVMREAANDHGDTAEPSPLALSA